jgi:hypothetical protein
VEEQYSVEHSDARPRTLRVREATAFKFIYLPHFVTLGTKSPSVSVHWNLLGYGSIDLLQHSVVVMFGS